MEKTKQENEEMGREFSALSMNAKEAAPSANSGSVTGTSTDLHSGAADNCSEIYGRFTQCLGTGHQFRTFHRTGEYEYCPAFWSDWTTCIRAKVTPGQERKTAIMSTTTFYRQKMEDDARKVPWWEAKEKPKWDDY